MGMYTEIIIKCSLKENLPETVNAVLNQLFNNEEEVENLPNHPFFSCPRWRAIGRCSSYYHIPWADANYRDGYLFSRSDLKNYDNEIYLFFDWLDPYINELPNTCIGWSWYEEDDVPELRYKK